MSREALDLVEQVAQAGRGSDGASVVERGELTLTLRPSGRTEWAWRRQPSSAPPQRARPCCDPQHTPLCFAMDEARVNFLIKRRRMKRIGMTMVLFASLYQ